MPLLDNGDKRKELFAVSKLARWFQDSKSTSGPSDN